MPSRACEGFDEIDASEVPARLGRGAEGCADGAGELLGEPRERIEVGGLLLKVGGEILEGEPLLGGGDVDSRREAAALDVAGKYEPNLRESGGIPADVLAKLLPGDDIIELEEPEVAGSVGYRFFKRMFDVCSCSVALVILAIPMIAVALKIRSESPGPVIYAQARVGKDGREFNVYKFRSMHIDAEKRGAQWTTGNDPRVTPFGRWMRDHRVDEIPQFWNVIKGDMSLVGPRPERPAFCDAFENRIHGWHWRTKVRPGLSGLAQVSGGYDLLPAEKVVYDFEYIKNRSLKMDARIILRTLGVLGTTEGAR